MAPASFADAEQDTQLLGISHVPKVLDRLGGGGQIAEGGEQRHDPHETCGSPVRNLSWHLVSSLRVAWGPSPIALRDVGGLLRSAHRITSELDARRPPVVGGQSDDRYRPPRADRCDRES